MRAEHILSAKGSAQNLMAIQYIVGAGVSGSVVLNLECPTVQGAVMAGLTLGLVCDGQGLGHKGGGLS